MSDYYCNCSNVDALACAREGLMGVPKCPCECHGQITERKIVDKFMEMKICTKCLQSKPFDDFYKLNHKYYMGECKVCHLIRKKNYRLNNMEKLKLLDKLKYKKCKQHHLKQNKKWQKNHKKYINLKSRIVYYKSTYNLIIPKLPYGTQTVENMQNTLNSIKSNLKQQNESKILINKILKNIDKLDHNIQTQDLELLSNKQLEHILSTLPINII